MNLKFQRRNIPLFPGLRERIKKRSQKITKLLPTFSSQDLDLHVTLEKLPHKKQYRTVLVLTTPQSTLRAEDIEDKLATSALRAFDELVRRIEKFKSQLNRQKLRRRRLATSVATSPTGKTGELRELKEAVDRYLPKIENYIRRELLHDTLTEGLPSGLLEPDAVIDEVFLEIVSRATEKPDDRSFEHWFYQVARSTLTDRIQALRLAREEPHVEESLRLSSPWEDEMLNFYQPDERLHLEDLLPDQKNDNPEESIVREEAEKQLRNKIARLPKPIRECFILSLLEGFKPDEVAMLTGTTPSTVLERIEEARKQLRQSIQ